MIRKRALCRAKNQTQFPAPEPALRRMQSGESLESRAASFKIPVRQPDHFRSWFLQRRVFRREALTFRQPQRQRHDRREVLPECRRLAGHLTQGRDRTPRRLRGYPVGLPIRRTCHTTSPRQDTDQKSRRLVCAKKCPLPSIHAAASSSIHSLRKTLSLSEQTDSEIWGSVIARFCARESTNCPTRSDSFSTVSSFSKIPVSK